MSNRPTYQELENRIFALEQSADKRIFSEKLTRTLLDISTAVNATHHLNDLYRSIYESLNRLMVLPNFYIALHDPDANMISFPFHIDENEDAAFGQRLFVDGASLTGEVIMKKEPLFLDEAGLKIRESQKGIVGAIPKVWIGVPLMVREKTIGVVAVQHYTDPDYFSRSDVDILMSVSNHIALAIERKQSLEERDILDKYLQNIINSMPSVLIGIDKNKRVTHWNAQASLETGLKPEDAVGKSLESVFPRLSYLNEKIDQSIAFNRIKTCLKQQSLHRGTPRFEDVVIFPVSSDRVDGVVIRIDDITEQVRMQEMMIQSEKMLSVGGLAAGMAHEINNPLAGMMQISQVIHNRLSQDLPANRKTADEIGIRIEDIREYMDRRKILEKLELINSTGSRAARIVKNMLSFAGKGSVYHKPVDLSALLKETLELAQSDYNLKKKYDFKSIRIIEKFSPNLPLVSCDHSKIQQVFLNILKNGAQAMFEQKDIKDVVPQFILETYQENRMVCIRITDNGPGVPKDQKKRLFEPFYTTKTVGEGTGLGLFVSYFIIVNDHHGDMTVESPPGKGTCFTIKLPCAR